MCNGKSLFGKALLFHLFWIINSRSFSQGYTVYDSLTLCFYFPVYLKLSFPQFGIAPDPPASFCMEP